MKKIGIVSYNIYGNFTNYGSALQSWALQQTIKFLGYQPVLVDYCPDILRDMDPLNPYKNMWDKDEESKKMCELTMPAIRNNYYKFNDFYTNRFYRTQEKYVSANFNDIVKNENLTGFVCGSDTIFCMDEFGFDDGYYANYECMQKHSVAYAASFGDSILSDDNCEILNKRLKNFLSIGLRENMMIPYVKSQVNVPVERVVDPTLLHTSEEYDDIAVDKRLEKDKYLLYYSRRYSPLMEEYVEDMARKNGWKIVEISLRVTNAEKGHRMFYEAGVEEFLSLVKYAEYVVTNSFHGIIFAVQYKKPFVVFSREQCNIKINEILELFGLKNRMLVTGKEKFNHNIDYDTVHKRIEKAKEKSLLFLKNELELLEE
ncbi:polysaccharide pyruvyl transferase family protein [Ligilactobacillus ruminis]|uniref:polysaccharide pyruvyl transferase family protein n=2 Tax=Ligilactobacillus ruminis TaxID=1623 RepID=UPI001F196F7A|nr:polysaccharide pyruvyl transferase family protein [Ligilactobacillus ruminis]MCF2544353.1 polysaccharide pyruvyl transferase family protein [Ligilactobacillus ruminis]